MRTIGQSAVLGMAFLTAAVTTANADPESRSGTPAAATITNGVGASGPFGSSEFPSRQIATLPPNDTSPSTPSSATLPNVGVYPQPYSTGGGPRASSYSAPRPEHYSIPPDYDTNVALHPYTSGLGPRASSNGTVRAEHFKMPADYDANAAMHPYTSRLSPCVQGQGIACQVPSSHQDH
jgi:hypothetical protein